MKTSLILIFILAAFTGSYSQNGGGEQRRTRIELTRNTTEKEIKTLQKELENEGIQLEFRKIEFSATGKLILAAGKISFMGGPSGTFSAKKFKKLVIYWNYTDKGTVEDMNIMVDEKKME